MTCKKKQATTLLAAVQMEQAAKTDEHVPSNKR
eukprot:CAMPEP_0177483326 /NCGR_PEP_ID=MMETSP0369-20130122/27409_1 /TAXON_ID=447022 ORGANISM="Scrippsiella hangoei-like, Strain SHHI-4" /NCGR_SAMPLE_ID=MMETSP0369 /ASSEMBLY_ACC=CAM_ASM_000364 /LENGTH=32 /DNA_ID= /DNA_START= /DNA_END= /DNA_ORIENTATION=